MLTTIHCKITGTILNFSFLVEGGGTILFYGDVQAAAGRGGRPGDDQGVVSPHHFFHANIGAHRGGIRNS